MSNAKKIVNSNSGKVTFENVTARGNDSVIELGGYDTQEQENTIYYCYLDVKGNTNIEGTVKLVFPNENDKYNGAIRICDKKSYTLKLDFGSNYNTAKDQQVVFLDNSVIGFTLADAVKNITVKPDGGNTYSIDESGYLRKR